MNEKLLKDNITKFIEGSTSEESSKIATFIAGMQAQKEANESKLASKKKKSA